ncbi:MAG: fasciclin domain-containing protein [Bacteroidota bacterium]
MKHLFYLLSGLVAAGIILSSCKKFSTPPTVAFSTPLQALINSDTSLSVFYAVVKKAGEDSLYGGTRAVTVLIPTNAAFAAVGITAATIDAMPANAADSLLRYHFIPDTLSLAPGSYQAYNSLLRVPVYGYGNPDSLGNYFNGSLAGFQKLPGSNATVYELSAPLQIPAASLASMLASDTSLSYFSEALKHASLDPATVTGWITLLAPDNAAFRAAGYATLADIDNADTNTLSNILQYHMLPQQYFSNGFTGLETVMSLQGTVIQLSFNNGLVQFTGTGNSMAAGITRYNRIAGDHIIVQNINGVLMP